MRTLLVLSVVTVSLLSDQYGLSVAVPNKKPKPVNLLLNGSFEEGPEAGQFKPLDKGSTAIKGWTVTRGQIDYVGSYWKAAHGQRSIDLHGSPGYGGVAQTFATSKGQRYRVTFSLAGTPGTGEKKMGVQAAA